MDFCKNFTEKRLPQNLSASQKSPRTRTSESPSGLDDDDDDVEVIETEPSIYKSWHVPNKLQKHALQRSGMSFNRPPRDPARTYRNRDSDDCTRPGSSSADTCTVPGGDRVSVRRRSANPRANHVSSLSEHRTPSGIEPCIVQNIDDDEAPPSATHGVDKALRKRHGRERRRDPAGNYDETQVAKDRARREGGKHTRPSATNLRGGAEAGPSDTIDLVNDEPDADPSKKAEVTHVSEHLDPPLLVRQPPRRSLRVQTQCNKLRSDHEEVAEEVKELSAVDAPYDGPTHLIFKYPPGGRGMINVTAEEQERLKQRKYLNDSLIDFYFKYLEETLNKRPPDMRFKTKFFSSFFFGVLRREKPIDYKGVKNWTRGIDLFSLDFVFVPICDSYHWSLIIVANLHELESFLQSPDERPGPGSPKIIYLDSLDPKRGEEFGTSMVHYLANEYAERKLKGDATDSVRKKTLDRFKESIPILKPHVPVQDNEYDCGLYVLNSLSMFLENRDDFMMKLLKGEDLTKSRVYSHIDIQKLRIKITILMDIFAGEWKRNHVEDTAGGETGVANTEDPIEELEEEKENIQGQDTPMHLTETKSSPLQDSSCGSPSNSGECASEELRLREADELHSAGSFHEPVVSWEHAQAANLSGGEPGRVDTMYNNFIGGSKEGDRMDLDDDARSEEGSDLDPTAEDGMGTQGEGQRMDMDIDGEGQEDIADASDDNREEYIKEEGGVPLQDCDGNKDDDAKMRIGDWQQSGGAEDIVTGERRSSVSRRVAFEHEQNRGKTSGRRRSKEKSYKNTAAYGFGGNSFARMRGSALRKKRRVPRYDEEDFDPDQEHAPTGGEVRLLDVDGNEEIIDGSSEFGDR